MENEPCHSSPSPHLSSLSSLFLPISSAMYTYIDDDCGFQRRNSGVKACCDQHGPAVCCSFSSARLWQRHPPGSVRNTQCQHQSTFVTFWIGTATIRATSRASITAGRAAPFLLLQFILCRGMFCPTSLNLLQFRLRPRLCPAAPAAVCGRNRNQKPLRNLTTICVCLCSTALQLPRPVASQPGFVLAE